MIKAVIIFLQTIHFFLSCVYGIAIGEGGGVGPPSFISISVQGRPVLPTTSLRRQGRGEWIKIDPFQILAQYLSKNITLGKFLASLRLYLVNSEMLILIPICLTVVRIEIIYVKRLHVGAPKLAVVT